MAGKVPKPKLLATLSDHLGPVNCIRFSHSGRFLATAADDHLIHVHELKPGVGAVSFGEAQSVENWAKWLTFSGHQNNVVDLAWAPDDAKVASCSLDNTVHVWDVTRGTLVQVFRDHTSFVKGVVWDPLGKYLASQSDDKSVIVRAVEGWQLVARVQDPFRKALDNTFSTRLSWAPDGSNITAMNAYQPVVDQKGKSRSKDSRDWRHTAAVVSRGSWERSHDYIGHRAPVVASAFNPHLFRSGDPQSAALSTCIALGSQDCKITVWISGKARPVLIAKTFFTRSIVDLSWSPCGRLLFAASIDGSIAYFYFREEELGEAVPKAEVEQLLRESYGEINRGGLGIAEDANLLQLEAEARPPETTGKFASPKLAGRAVVRVSPSPSKAQPAVVKSRKQIEQRGADGRRRINPVQLNGGRGGHVAVVGNGGAKKGLARRLAPEPLAGSPAKRANNGGGHATGAGPPSAGAFGAPQLAPQGIAPPPTSKPVLAAPGEPQSLFHQLDAAGEGGAVVFEAVNSMAGRAAACELKCRTNDKVLWGDKVADRVNLVAGSPRVAVAATKQGFVHVFSRNGRRLFPPLCLGAPAAFLACGEKTERPRSPWEEAADLAPVDRESRLWRVLAVSALGKLFVWDVKTRKCALSADLATVCAAEGEVGVVAARLSSGGIPLVVLSNRHALAYSESMQCWVRVADGTHLLSDFSSSLVANAGGASGELAELNAAATATTATRSGAGAFLGVSPLEQKEATGRHLEFLLNASLALENEEDYRVWLAHYARHLSQESEAAKLQELCDELMGPVTAIPTGPAAEAFFGTAEAKATRWWNPKIGSSDKRTLLRKVVLPAVVSANKGMQRIATQCLDILEEIGGGGA